MDPSFRDSTLLSGSVTGRSILAVGKLLDYSCLQDQTSSDDIHGKMDPSIPQPNLEYLVFLSEEQNLLGSLRLQ